MSACWGGTFTPVGVDALTKRYCASALSAPWPRAWLLPVMAAAGRWISYAMTDRWAFEALGKTLNLNRLFEHRFPTHPQFDEEVRDSVLKRVVERVQQAAGEPDQRVLIQDHAN